MNINFKLKGNKMKQQIGIELEDSKYYIVWVAPNPDFPEEKVTGVPELTRYMDAVNICAPLNRDTKGTKGVYEIRKETK